MSAKIILYGKSIFISSMEASLRDTFSVTMAQGDFMRLPNPLDADYYVVADLCEEETIRALPELSVLGIPLVGINSARGTVAIIYGRSQSVHSIQELIKALNEAIAVRNRPAPNKEYPTLENTTKGESRI
jgi:hypothetical protein